MNPAATVNGVPIRPRSGRRWPWVLLALTLLAFAALAALWTAFDAMDAVPVNIMIDGEEVLNGIDLAALPAGQQLVLAAAVLFVALLVAVIVPMALLAALAVVVMVLLLAFGLPLLAALAVLALGLSPLALLAWLVWRALRPSPTMPR